MAYYESSKKEATVVPFPTDEMTEIGNACLMGGTANDGKLNIIRSANQDNVGLSIYSSNGYDGNFYVNPGDGLLRFNNYSNSPSYHSYNVRLAQNVFDGSSEDWRNAPTIGEFVAYCYEGGSSAGGAPIPYEHCFVFVSKALETRGIAFAFNWPKFGGNMMWINKLHDTWRGWVRIL